MSMRPGSGDVKCALPAENCCGTARWRGIGKNRGWPYRIINNYPDIEPTFLFHRRPPSATTAPASCSIPIPAPATDGWDLHQLRHSAATTLGEKNTSLQAPNGYSGTSIIRPCRSTFVSCRPSLDKVFLPPATTRHVTTKVRHDDHDNVPTGAGQRASRPAPGPAPLPGTVRAEPDHPRAHTATTDRGRRPLRPDHPAVRLRARRRRGSAGWCSSAVDRGRRRPSR